MWVGSSVLDQGSSPVTFEDENEKEDEDEYLSKDFKHTARALFHQWLQGAVLCCPPQATAPSHGPKPRPRPAAAPSTGFPAVTFG